MLILFLSGSQIAITAFEAMVTSAAVLANGSSAWEDFLIPNNSPLNQSWQTWTVLFLSMNALLFSYISHNFPNSHLSVNIEFQSGVCLLVPVLPCTQLMPRRWQWFSPGLLGHGGRALPQLLSSCLCLHMGLPKGTWKSYTLSLCVLPMTGREHAQSSACWAWKGSIYRLVKALSGSHKEEWLVYCLDWILAPLLMWPQYRRDVRKRQIWRTTKQKKFRRFGFA